MTDIGMPERVLYLAHSVPEVEQPDCVEPRRNLLDIAQDLTSIAFEHLNKIASPQPLPIVSSREHLRLVGSKGPRSRQEVIARLHAIAHGDDFDGNPAS